MLAMRQRAPSFAFAEASSFRIALDKWKRLGSIFRMSFEIGIEPRRLHSEKPKRLSVAKRGHHPRCFFVAETWWVPSAHRVRLQWQLIPVRLTSRMSLQSPLITGSTGNGPAREITLAVLEGKRPEPTRKQEINIQAAILAALWVRDGKPVVGGGDPAQWQLKNA